MLRHDDEEDEAYYDDRSEADDDTDKGYIRFPEAKLFGRMDELQQLKDAYTEMMQPGGKSQVVFMDGYSGVGKSALVVGLVQELREQSLPCIYAFGEYNEHASSDPFSAITQAMGKLSSDLLHGDEGALQRIQNNLQRAGFFDSDEASLLLEIMPELSPIIKNGVEVTSGSSGRRDLKHLTYVFGNFLRCLCMLDRPLILFLDDLQWADPASLELMAAIVSTMPIEQLMFVGCYRSNEVDSNHPLQKHIMELESERSLKHIQVSNLSVYHITTFVAETLALPREEVAQLAEGIYSRTLGNISFCRQAIEELARKNVIYYDVMFFRWNFNLSAVKLKTVLSNDFVEMIQTKLESLPSTAQRALVLAAHIRNINIPALLATLKAEGNDMRTGELETLLDHAVLEGLLLHPAATKGYKFADDSVQEAAYTSVPPGEERDRLLVRIATVLIGLTTGPSRSKDDWMLFVAAEYFQSVPKTCIILDSLKLAKLFLRVADLSLGKGSFDRSVEMLRTAVVFLRKKVRMWVRHYDLCLTLFNRLLETEFAVGNYEETKAAIEEVEQHAKCPSDMCTAHHTKVAMTVEVNDRNHVLGVIVSAKLLSLYGQKIPMHPSKKAVLFERLLLKLTLRSRPISVLMDLPIMEDDSVMKLLFQLCHLLSLTRNHSFNTFVTFRALRLSLEKGISKYLPQILVNYCAPLRISGRLNMAYYYASLATKLYERFPEERGGDYAISQMMLHSGILPLKQPFQDGIDAHFGAYRLALAAGNTETALAAAMHFPMHYYASGLPLNAFLETKLILFEEKARLLHQSGFMVLFQCCRQFLYNLQGKSMYTSELKGTVMDEEEILGSLEGNSKEMTTRDFSIFRMVLAYIFGDDETMECMLTRLEPYPLFDLALVRQHLRLTFNGLAALKLGRQKKCEAYTKLGQKIMKEVQKLDKIGSVNAGPVYMCLKAANKHKRAAYDEAISSCSIQKLLHLEAMMNEQCGLLLLEEGDKESARDYLGKALWLFRDWGALAKFKQLKTRFDFLVDFPPQAATERTSLSDLMPQSNRLQVGRRKTMDHNKPKKQATQSGRRKTMDHSKP
jgi:predicted ATPase